MTSRLLAVGVLLIGTIAMSAHAAQVAVPATNAGQLKPTLAGKPVIDTVRSGPAAGEFSVVFAAPATNGTTAIASYAYSTDGGANGAVRDDAGTTTSALTITSRSDGKVLSSSTTYVVLIAAVNATGRGLPSNA